MSDRQDNKVWTPEQEAFNRVRLRAVDAAHNLYPDAMEFRLVYHPGRRPAGWTFHTGHYPRSNFGWVTVRGFVGSAVHEIRLHARKNLKEQGEDR